SGGCRPRCCRGRCCGRDARDAGPGPTCARRPCCCRAGCRAPATSRCTCAPPISYGMDTRTTTPTPASCCTSHGRTIAPSRLAARLGWNAAWRELLERALRTTAGRAHEDDARRAQLTRAIADTLGDEPLVMLAALARDGSPPV